MKSFKELYPEIGAGWHSLLDQLDAVSSTLNSLPWHSRIKAIKRQNGMLVVEFDNAAELEESHPVVFIWNAIIYKLERISAKTCEHCGAYGLRRLGLSEIKCLCTRCYTLEYDKYHSSTPA